MESFFLNSAVVASGAALISSPIIIHIINRLRFRRVRFAAMEFLLQSQQKNRRRILIEQLLLLLLRILIVLFIMLLIARLVLDSSALSIIRGKAAEHHVILIDDSGSMLEQAGDKTAFDKARDLVKRLVKQGAGKPGTQKATIVLLSKPNAPLHREANVDSEFLDPLDKSLTNQKCTFRRLDVVAGMKEAGKLLLESKESRTAIKYLHVISDFRSDDWTTTDPAVQTIEELTNADVSVNFFRTVEQGQSNLGITRVTGIVETAAANVPMRIAVAVKNFGKEKVENVAVSIYADGKKLPRTVVFEEISPGVEAVKNADIRFPESGEHRLRLELPPDALAADNVRYLGIDNLLPVNRVLLIDGDPKAADAQYVADALSADRSITGIQPEIHDPDWLRRNSLEPFQCIYLMNVSELADDAIDPLENYVREGGGLAWFVGPLVNAKSYNDKLYRIEKMKAKDGSELTRVTGLFPVPLQSTAVDLLPKAPGSLIPDLDPNPAHPIFRVLTEAEVIGVFEFMRFWPTAEQLPDGSGPWERDDNKRKDGVVTIARLRGGSPFMFEHRFGEGRIVSCLTSAGAQWSNWARLRYYAIIQLELRQQIARRTSGRLRGVGQPIDEQLPVSQYSGEVMVGDPDLGPTQTTPLKTEQVLPQNVPDPSAGSPGNSTNANGAKTPLNVPYHSVRYNETDKPGIYKLVLRRLKGAKTAGAATEVRLFSYNVPGEEGATAVISKDDLTKSIPESDQFKIYKLEDDAVLRGKTPDQEWRKYILISLIVLLMVEQLLAYKLGYHSAET